MSLFGYPHLLHKIKQQIMNMLSPKPQRVFISLSYQHRHELRVEVECIVSTLQQHQIESTVFVDQYTFQSGHEHERMRVALDEIRRADVLIAEGSYKAIGIGIEIGYAIALQKPVVYLRHATAEYSTTVGGVATVAIVYNSTDDLAHRLNTLLAQQQF